MPELPEVQTVVNDLNEKIRGDKVVSFWSEWPKAIKNKKLKDFQKEIIGRKVLGVRRVGKNIFIDLNGDKTLYIHLKMTGHLLVKFQNPNDKLQIKSKIKNLKNTKPDYFSDRVNQYIRHKWTLKDKKGKLKTIEFSDMRKFAKIVLDDTEKIKNLKEIKALGVDALSAEFTFQKFQEILSKKPKGQIGIILLDQNLIAGIGNIYRSEILFEAGILPDRPIEKITLPERKKLYAAIGKILKKAVKLRGTSDSDYRDTSGAPGGFQKVLKVYRKEKQKCQKCGTMVQRKTLGQRSVFFCPECQK
ncbi:MAG: bifunctional DNA-formamidopyrimidine glycosylase/DNA-(apurinic or apyrimidinic site) lyase [Parcubacteria group bacterium]